MIQKIWNDKKYFIWDNVVSSQLDHVAIGMMEQNQIEGLLPFRIFQTNGKSDFRYEIREGIALEKWLEKKRSKKEVVALLESIVALEEEADFFLLENNHLYTEKSAIIVHQNRCRIPYIPLVDYKEGSCIALVRQILFQLKYVINEDYTYIFELMNAISRGEITSIKDLKKWLKRLDEGWYTQNTSQIDTEGFSAPYFHTENQVQEKIVDEKKEVVKEKKGLFNFKKKKSPISDEPQRQIIQEEKKIKLYENKSSHREEDDDFETGIFPLPEEQCILIKSSTGKKICLKGNSMILGRENQAINIHILGNTYVGKIHAKLYKRGKEWILEDNGSKNGTYINGERLKPGASGIRSLHHGDTIRLANEEFVFVLDK